RFNNALETGVHMSSSVDADQLLRFGQLIGGAEVQSASGKTYRSLDPYTGKPWAEVPDGGKEDIDHAVEAARDALNGEWGRLTATARGKLLRKVGDIIAREADNLAELEVRDGGKLMREMSGQMKGLPEYYYYYAGLADKLEGSVVPTDKSNFL